MYKRIIYWLLVLFLFIFISVTFLIPSDLVAETRKFWVDTSHWGTENVWVTSGYFQDTWVDTSHNEWVTSGYLKYTQEKRWVDTSHMVYQGYWSYVTKSVWVDTSQWVSSGYWGEDVIESVWVDTSHWAWITSGYGENYWVDTSHNVWVSEGHYEKRWVDTSHNVWVSEGHYEKRWVDTSHWVTSGYWVYYPYRKWVDTSHWVTSGYLQDVWVDTSHYVWVTSGYLQDVWVDTSHYVWVTSGYLAYRWVDTSHNEWVTSGYLAYRWVDTSHNEWVTSGYWEDQKVWVDTSHYELRWRYVEDWQPCDKTVLEVVQGIGLYNWFSDYNPTKIEKGPFEGVFEGKSHKYNIIEYWYKTGLFSEKELFYIEYKYFEVLNWKGETYPELVEGGHWKREWVDTSHWENSGYWQSFTYRTWVDTSYMVESGYWENYTERIWIDTSYNEWVTEGHTERTWVDTSHFETQKVWVEDGYWVEAELDPEGKVLHTEQWNINRINYNLSITDGRETEKPRGYEIFFNGEKFVLEADTLGDFQPESVHVEFLGTKFETDLTIIGDSKWEGYIWDKSFIYFHDRDCVFKFTASYNYNGDKFEIEDEVTVYIVRDYYWELHRGF